MYTNITRKGQTAFAQAYEMTGKGFATNAEVLPTQITKVCSTSRNTTVTDSLSIVLQNLTFCISLNVKRWLKRARCVSFTLILITDPCPDGPNTHARSIF